MTLARIPTEHRLAHEAPLALGSVLWRAHDRARALEAVLELEAASDPRVAELQHAARTLRKGVAGLLVELAADEAAEATGPRDTDCSSCLVAVDHCERDASMGAGRCCEECRHA